MNPDSFSSRFQKKCSVVWYQTVTVALSEHSWWCCESLFKKLGILFEKSALKEHSILGRERMWAGWLWSGWRAWRSWNPVWKGGMHDIEVHGRSGEVTSAFEKLILNPKMADTKYRKYFFWERVNPDSFSSRFLKNWSVVWYQTLIVALSEHSWWCWESLFKKLGILFE